MHNHHLLQITGKPKWLTLRGGRLVVNMVPTTARTCSAVLYSRTYVQKILSKLPPAQLHLSTPIKALESVPVSDKTGQTHTVKLTTAAGETLEFDHVIMACHTDTTVDILNAGGGMSKEEARILEAFKWNRNEAVLHCDERVSSLSESKSKLRNVLTGRFTADAQGPHCLVVLELPDQVGDGRLGKVPSERQPGVIVSRVPQYRPRCHPLILVLERVSSILPERTPLTDAPISNST